VLRLVYTSVNRSLRNIQAPQATSGGHLVELELRLRLGIRPGQALG